MSTTKKSSSYSKKYVLSYKDRAVRLEKKLLEKAQETAYLKSFLFYDFFNTVG